MELEWYSLCVDRIIGMNEETLENRRTNQIMVKPKKDISGYRTMGVLFGLEI
jgi:hypothetical protein